MSKGLDCLERLKAINESSSGYIEKYYIEPIEKELKAFEIIKPLSEVYSTPKCNYRYLKVGGVVVYKIKSQEEFELLKEVLCND